MRRTLHAGLALAVLSTAPARPAAAEDLTIVSTVNTGRTNITLLVSGNQLTLSWPSDHTGWRLQSQTNPVTVGLLSNWFDVPGSTTTNQIITTVNPASGSVFYRMVYP